MRAFVSLCVIERERVCVCAKEREREREREREMTMFSVCSEELYEDESFPERELSALVASKVSLVALIS